MPRVNIHLYPSFFTNESRILREARAIVDLGISDEVILIGLWKEGLLREEIISERIRLIRVKGLFRKRVNSSWSNIFVLIFFFFHLIAIAIRAKPFAINVHALTMLPFAVVVAWVVRSSLIYDAHELETETHASRGFRRAFARGVERVFIRFVDYTVVVSHSIEKWYRDEYGLSEIITIKNIPVFRNKEYVSDLKSRLGLKGYELLFVYVGLFSSGRGIDQIIRCFRREENKDFHVVFIGYGDMEDAIKKSVQSNIHYLPAVAPDQLAALISGGDVGLSLIEASCLSYYYSLPNKVFEYLSAGLPFICSDFPDVKQEFAEFEVCWFSDLNGGIEEIVGRISRQEIELKKSNVIKHRARWDWSVEKLKLIDVYRSIEKIKI